MNQRFERGTNCGSEPKSTVARVITETASVPVQGFQRPHPVESVGSGAMAKLKSLSSGLAGAKRAGEATTKALRKLFGRPNAEQPEGEGAAATSTGSGSDSQDRLSRDDAAQQQLNSGSDPASALRTNKNPASNSNPSSNNPKHQQEHGADMQTTVGKENDPPRGSADDVASSMKKLDLSGTSPKQDTLAPTPILPVTPVEEEARPLTPDELLSPEERAFRQERRKHLVFIEEALDMARLALRTNETPVGCVLVHNEKVIARGMNATNVTRNGTRHAEFMAICALLSYAPKHGPKTTSLKPRIERNEELDDDASVQSPQPDEGNEDGSKGHLYPYGQKEVPDERVDRNILKECILYVTVEPCVMCASLLRQVGIKKVFFGAVNDKFGGTGGVFSIHANSFPVRDDGQTASAHPQPPPMRLPDGKQVLGTSFPSGGGDGGNVEPGYEIEGGWGRDEAVGLLRRFYVQENGRAPVPRKKEGRAARLQAIMEGDNASMNESGSGSNGTGSDGDEGASPGDGAQRQGIEDENSSRPQSSHAHGSSAGTPELKQASLAT